MRKHCHNTEDVFNPYDVATARINHDYGTKTRAKPEPPYTILSGGPLKVHGGKFAGRGKKKAKAHRQQALLDLAYSTLKKQKR